MKGLLFSFICLASVMVGCKSTKPVVNSYTVKDSTVVNYRTVEVPVPGQQTSAAVNLDSLMNLLKENKPVIINGQVPSGDGKMLLQYWTDAFGKLQIRCQTQDQVLNVLAAEITRLREEQKIETVIHTEYRTPVWNYILVVLLAAALIISLFKR